MTLGKTKTSIEASRSSRTKRAMSSPFLVYWRLRSVTTPPTQRTRPSAARPLIVGSPPRSPSLSASRSSAREHRFHPPQGVIADVEPQHLLLEGEALGLVELDVGDRHPGALPVPDVVVAFVGGHRGEQRGDADLVLAASL